MRPRRPRASDGTTGGAAPATRRLQRVLDDLGAAKQRLLDATAAMRVVDGRVRLWDLSEPFQARRSHALRAEVTVSFGAALEQLHALLQRLPEDSLGAGPRRTRDRRLLAEIRGQLRYLQRAFDGGSLLLARALASADPEGEGDHREQRRNGEISQGPVFD